MKVTADAIIERIRRLFLEEATGTSGTDFIDNDGDFPFEVLDAYDQGCQRQHKIVLQNASKTGMLFAFDHNYLASFLEWFPISIVAGTQDYTAPEDMAQKIALYVTMPDDRKKQAVWVGPEYDRSVQLWPAQYTPVRGDYHACIFPALASSDSPPDYLAPPIIRIYAYGNRAIPEESASAVLNYYRQINPIAFTSPMETYADVPDPYNDGPCLWAVGLLFRKAQLYDRAMKSEEAAEAAMNLVIPPPPPPPPMVRR
jgi:hypothetical protein